MAFIAPPRPPESEAQLDSRARHIAGRTLGDLADDLSVRVPKDLRRAKGWVGQLVERALGATAGNQAIPDFVGLGVELKTVPVRADGSVLESTFVTYAPLAELGHTAWEDSSVRGKLARVLWLPVEGDPMIPVGQRRIGSPLVWSPDDAERRVLQNDWYVLQRSVQEARFDDITGSIGEALHLRPKARNRRSRCWALGEDGAPQLTLPRGFYLRSHFTRGILGKHFLKDIS